MKMQDILGEITQAKVLGSRNLTMIRVFEAEEEFKNRAFSGAVGTDDAHPLPSIHLKGTVLQNVLLGKRFTYFVK
jgi:hypothetical protein